MSIQAVPTVSGTQAPRGQEFRYESYQADPATGELTCHYSVDGRRFTEQITFRPGCRLGPPGHRRGRPAGVPPGWRLYYKTAAPPVIHTGDLALTRRERSFLRQFYLEGLGEFAYRNQLTCPACASKARTRPGPPRPPPPAPHPPATPPGARWSRSAAESTRSSPSNWSAPAPTSRCSW